MRVRVHVRMDTSMQMCAACNQGRVFCTNECTLQQLIQQLTLIPRDYAPPPLTSIGAGGRYSAFMGAESKLSHTTTSDWFNISGGRPVLIISIRESIVDEKI